MSCARSNSHPGHRSWTRSLRVQAAALVFATAFAGCEQDAVPTTSKDQVKPTIDALGGATNSVVFASKRTPTEGLGGPGGEIKIESMVGDVQILGRLRTFDPLTVVTQTLTGPGGLTVGSDQVRRLKGGQLLTYLNVRPGGKIVLEGNTFLNVSGDVFIGGEIVSDAGDTGKTIDGPELTIFCDGSMVVTGTIDTSGFRSDDSEGGDGGDIFIASGTALNAADDVLMVFTGFINARGGDSRSQDVDASSGGEGGLVQIGTYGQMLASGRVSSRAGQSYTNNLIFGAPGGDISVVAVGDILWERVDEINSSGGDSSGAPGDGGTIIIEASNGTLAIDGLDIEALGGDTLFLTASSGGAGGTISLNGTTVTTTNAKLIARGGDSIDGVDGIGGNAGSVNYTGNALIDIEPGADLKLRGGHTRLEVFDGGGGGTFRALAMDPLGVIAFDGIVNVRGGKTATLKLGPPGGYCVFGLLSAQSEANIIGANFFPLVGCPSDTVDTLPDAVNELDNFDTTIRPESLVTFMDVVPIRAFRIFPDTSTDMEITVTGQDEGDVDIYVIDGDELANVQAGVTPIFDLTLPGNFFASAATLPSGSNAESLTITTGDFPSIVNASGFFLLVVVEAAGVVGDFTVDV